MTDLQVGIYFICFAIVAGASFAFMFKMMTTTLEEFNKPVQRNVHPEMSDVQSGEELLVFKASLEEEDDDDEGDVVVIRK